MTLTREQILAMPAETEKAATLARLVRQAWQRDNAASMRLFGSNTTQMLALDVERAHVETPSKVGWTPEARARAATRYPEVLPTVRDVARAHGYAIGVHGSQARDLDLIAAPWTEEATGPEALVEALRVALDGLLLNAPGRTPATKPHGRLAWSIHLGGSAARGEGGDIEDVHLYLDLSIMPRAERT